MFTKNQIKLFLATLVSTTVVCNLNQVSASSPETEIRYYSKINLEPKPIKLSLDSQVSIFTIGNSDVILAKKSGGRSGGGSFKSKPSRSKKSSPRNSSNQRKITSPSRSYDSKNSTSPTYGNPATSYPRQTSPTYTDYSSTRHSRRNSSFGNFFLVIFVLIFLGGLIFVLFYLFNQMFGSNSDSSNKTERKVIKERDNDRVTVSLLQVVLSSGAEELQQDLSDLSTTVDTSTDEGLVELMRESVLALLRHDLHWTHVWSNSNSLDISQAEQEFDKLSFAQRSKFTGESLSNVDGQIKTRQSRSEDSEGFPAYVVVTLILGTADDNPLFSKIHSLENLKEVLLKLSSIREDYLIKFELLWTPQTTNEYLTEDELLMEYTDVMPLS